MVVAFFPNTIRNKCIVTRLFFLLTRELVRPGGHLVYSAHPWINTFLRIFPPCLIHAKPYSRYSADKTYTRLPRASLVAYRNAAKMSTTLFKPIAVDIPRIRSTLMAERKLLARGLAGARRALFQPVDPVETQRFLDQELAKQATKDADKWEFNFKLEVPMSPTGRTGRYIWSPVLGGKREYPPKRPLELDVEDISDLYPQPLDDVRPVIETSSESRVTAIAAVSTGKRQLRLTGKHFVVIRSPDFKFQAQVVLYISSTGCPSHFKHTLCFTFQA